MKLITHLLIFAIGAGLGIWWGATHPAQADNIARLEQKNVFQAKIDVYKQVATESNDPTKKEQYTQEAADEQKKLDDFNAANPGIPAANP